MRRLLSGDRNRGFTLIEVMIASLVLSLVLSALCSVYFAVSKEWERQNGRGTALAATSMACSRLSDYISQSVGAVVVNRIGTADALAVNLPADTAYSGTYVPTWSSGKIQYRSGNWIIFYLSDSTGNYSRSGDILWCATMNWGSFPGSVTPDATWSLYYDQPRGRITPISSIQFTLNAGSLPSVTVVATSNYSVQATQKQVQLTRTVCLLNAY